MKKIELEKRLYSVASMNEYTDNPELFSPKFTAIESNNGVVLPIKGKNDIGPGYYYQPGAMVCYVVKPEDEAAYSISKIIDYTNPSSIGDIINKNNLIKDIQQDIMTTSDNILYFKIGDNNTPEMRAVKEAINAKQVDKKQYEDRFEQFQNDMRLLKGDSITLGKMISICSAFDIAVELTLRDKPDIPNPMNTEFTVDLTRGRDIK